jgi:hypothetical protein
MMLRRAICVGLAVFFALFFLHDYVDRKVRQRGQQPRAAVALQTREYD